VVSLRAEVRKKLWANAGNRCAFPGCVQRLVSDLGMPDQPTSGAGAVVGEEAHIRSSKATGPRHDPGYPAGKLNEYENLVLLCPTHHTIVDKDGGSAWPLVEVLKMKAAHEERVDALLSDSSNQSPTTTALESRIHRWEELINLAGWEELTQRLNFVHPYLALSDWQSLAETAIWLAGVDWPPHFPKLAVAFATHRAVLEVLISHISDAFVRGQGELEIRRRHKETYFDGPDGEQLYTEAISEFGVNDAVTGVLVLELTRTVNLVILAVRDEVLPLYRFNDGLIQMVEGDLIWGLWSSHPSFDPLDWGRFPREYDLEDIKSRVTDELHGGDPRNGRTMDVWSFDPSTQADAGTEH